MTDKTHERLTWIAAVIAFVACFLAIMTGHDGFAVNLVLGAIGVALGYSIGTIIRRRRS